LKYNLHQKLYPFEDNEILILSEKKKIMVFGFYYQKNNLIYNFLLEGKHCNSSTCNSTIIKVGENEYEYQWIDIENGILTPISCSAPDYFNYLFNWNFKL
jgi:hypothetical protein